MNRHHFVAFGILAASTFAGCNRTTDSDPQQSNSNSDAMTTVNIHVDGFRKSRSGAT
jgi:hypothetical protein